MSVDYVPFIFKNLPFVVASGRCVPRDLPGSYDVVMPKRGFLAKFCLVSHPVLCGTNVSSECC